MRFADPVWLFGTLIALAVAGLLVAGGVLLLRAVRRFGDEARVNALITSRAGGRRALKGVLLVLAVALAFVALAKPQYGRGTRLIPATDLDVVVVLDYSKSMYARDVVPSRIARAKIEVGQLIQDLPGARFGAVAFAGEPMSFPLTSDGAAIAQFFRQLSPNDMPVGGTAIARALTAGRELLERDPLSRTHRKVLVLVTDGEDLEGDPVTVAESAASAGITIDVVQIGGRTPEPIPEVNAAGEVTGLRTDDQGKPLTTSLSAAGEAQLARIAELTRGMVVRSEHGETGIRAVARSLGRMKSELSERVETVYADVYAYPLGLAILLLVAETFVGESRRRRRAAVAPPPKRRRRARTLGASARAAGAAATALLAVAVTVATGCQEGENQLFLRNAPEVDRAMEAYDAGDAGAAVELLESYLSTGKCEKGEIGTPDSVRRRHAASFDLGLGLFKIAESFGRRFGDEEPLGDAGPTPAEEQATAERAAQVECALRIVQLVSGDRTVPIDLRARAWYLAGNLEFLRRQYRAAVTAYDAALALIPGLPDDAGDGIGRDAAWNRAIALARLEDEKNRDAGRDAQPEASPDSGEDSGNDAGPDSGEDGGEDGGGKDDGGEDGGERDGGHDGGGGRDAGADGSDRQPDAGSSRDGGQPPRPQPSAQNQPQPPNANQDERMLDMLEHAPTLQHQTAKDGAPGRRVQGAEDK